MVGALHMVTRGVSLAAARHGNLVASLRGQGLDQRLNFACAAAYRPSFRKLSASTPTRRDTSSASHCSGTTLTIGASRSSIAGVCRRSVASRLAAEAPTATIVAPISLTAAA